MKLVRKKILILCTGNSCRSQMAEGFIRKAGLLEFSAGTIPESEVNPYAVKVMAEIGLDISQNHPKSVKEYLDDDFYLVATVCDNARESCPVFSGKCEKNIHHSFIDPAIAPGNNEEKLEVFRNLRDEIREWVKKI